MGKINAKSKGNRFELEMATLLRECGFNAVTSRLQSKALDDAGVDLFTDAPYNIQCKHTERFSMPVHEILSKMPDNKTPIVMHKRNNKGTVVSMSLESFIEILIKSLADGQPS